jgi:hypothetical protein
MNENGGNEATIKRVQPQPLPLQGENGDKKYQTWNFDNILFKQKEDEMDELQREVLMELGSLLSTMGSANDAEDHGYCDDAERMRQESCDAMQRLLTDHAFLGTLIPNLEEEMKTGHIFNFGWSNLRQQVETALQFNGRVP